MKIYTLTAIPLFVLVMFEESTNGIMKNPSFLSYVLSLFLLSFASDACRYDSS